MINEIKREDSGEVAISAHTNEADAEEANDANEIFFLIKTEAIDYDDVNALDANISKSNGTVGEVESVFLDARPVVAHYECLLCKRTTKKYKTMEKHFQTQHAGRYDEKETLIAEIYESGGQKVMKTAEESDSREDGATRDAELRVDIAEESNLFDDMQADGQMDSDSDDYFADEDPYVSQMGCSVEGERVGEIYDTTKISEFAEDDDMLAWFLEKMREIRTAEYTEMLGGNLPESRAMANKHLTCMICNYKVSGLMPMTDHIRIEHKRTEPWLFMRWKPGQLVVGAAEKDSLARKRMAASPAKDGKTPKVAKPSGASESSVALKPSNTSKVSTADCEPGCSKDSDESSKEVTDDEILSILLEKVREIRTSKYNEMMCDDAPDSDVIVSKAFTCMICNNKENDVWLISEHIKSAHGKEEPWLFMTWKTLSIEKVTRDTDMQYECEQCDHVSRRKMEFLMHLHAEHGADADIFKDVYWTDIFEKTGMQYKCENCGKNFLTPKNLCFHISGAHPESFALMDAVKHGVIQHCADCNAVYLYQIKDNFRCCDRGKTVRAKEKKYMCDVCALFFDSKNALQDHKNRHLGLKPYVCDICSKAFSIKYRMHDHRAKHLNPFSHPCFVAGCQEKFKENLSLKRHLYKVHNVFLTRMECPVCKEPFPYTDYLKSHMKKAHNVT